MSERDVMQWGPYPTILADLVKRYRIMEKGWRWRLTDADHERDEDHGRGAAGGLTLIISAHVADTYHPEQTIIINHYFPVPGATYNEDSWRRWLFDCYAKVRLHECMENFHDENGFRPYAPNHGPGEDVYVVREMNSDERRRTQYTGGLDHNRARPDDWPK